MAACRPGAVLFLAKLQVTLSATFITVHMDFFSMVLYSGMCEGELGAAYIIH